MTLSLEVVLALGVAALELHTPVAPAELQSIAEQPIAEEERIGEVWRIAEQPFEVERWFEGELLLEVALTMVAAATMGEATVIQTINTAVEPPTMAAEFIVAPLW